MPCQILLSGLSVILFKSVAYQDTHMAAQAAVDQPHEWGRHNQDQTLVTISRAAMFKFLG